MIDITQEANRVIREKDYILDKENFYEISTDTIHLKDENFSNPFTIFVLLHEVAHRYQSRFLNVNEIDIQTLEREACDIAYAGLPKMGVFMTPRITRTLCKFLSNKNLQKTGM